MIGLVPLLSVLTLLTLLGAAATWWLRRRPADTGSARPLSTPASRGQDLLPRSEDGERGLAAFYAYQMAAGKIDRAQ